MVVIIYQTALILIAALRPTQQCDAFICMHENRPACIYNIMQKHSHKQALNGSCLSHSFLFPRSISWSFWDVVQHTGCRGEKVIVLAGRKVSLGHTPPFIA